MNIPRFLGLSLAAVSFAAGAASVDLADKPLASGTSGEVKPNIMIILDDSGSMDWPYLPDFVSGLSSDYGYYSSQCNGVYYNPAQTYSPPLYSDGSSYPDASFTGAKDNGYASSSTSVDLTSKYYYKYTGTQPAMSYTYTSSGSVDTSTTFYKECASGIGSTPGKNVFTKVTLTSASAEATNFANWYTYYRKRIYTAKAALGRALGNISEADKYRIGYTTHSYTGTDTSNSEFQKIDDFCTGATNCSQRSTLYTKIYGASATGGTPLRAALSKVGRIYAGKIGDDPVQYSCQQNFTILTTDGFWNGDDGYKLDGTSAVGNQDGSASPPMWDGGTGSKQVDTYQRYSYTTASCSTSTKKSVYKQLQEQTVTTPIDPPGTTVTGAWVNVGSSTKIVSCSTSYASSIPSPNPTAAVLVSSNTMSSSGGTSDSLADVAMYYYQTDLRDSSLSNCTGAAVGATNYDVCENNVPGSGNDTAPTQHMTTFTLGLGVDGSLKYCDNYDQAGACADYEALKQGTKMWPNPMDAEDLHRVDDLWHAAVNGRGKYFSAKSPESLASSLSKALSGVSARTASAAAAATSNLEPVAGDNYAYVAMYTTVDWDGDIEAREIDLSTGAVSSTAIWSAKTQLDTQVSSASDTRTIYFNDGGTLKAFTAANLSTYTAANNFQPGPTNPNGTLSQYAGFDATQQAQATQTSIVNFLRGQSQNEDQDGNTYRLYRDRKHALGDIVNGAPVYARNAPFSYSDDNYAAFVANNASRQGVVYAAANDGMLHAFNGDTGAEIWGFVPSAVIPKLYLLADTNYSTNHRFYVDGPMTVGDICPSAPGSSCNANQWKTIIVGGLGKGGRAYYALDVTNPASPSMLWEFTDNNLGYTYGNPIITKHNGQWVVIVASGYNNAPPDAPSGDGKGRIFVLNAATGAKIEEIVTDGAVTDPALSGIAKISNWVDNTQLDNSTQHVYGGDLDGNVWRFDITNNTVVKLAVLGKVSGAPTQAVTTKPQLAEVKIGGAATRVILVGTGEYLGTTDVSTTGMMSLYAIKDDLTSPPYGNFRTNANTVQQNLGGSTSTRQITYTAMQSTNVGWYMDLDVRNGERVTVDPKYQMGWWAVPSNIPDPNVCNIGGSSWLYFVDPWPTSNKTSTDEQIVNVGNSLVVGINIVKLPNGKTVTITTTSDAKYPVYGNPPLPGGTQVRRLYWRELTK